MEMEKKRVDLRASAQEGSTELETWLDCQGEKVEVKGNSEIPPWSIDCVLMLSTIVWYTKGKGVSGDELDLRRRRLNIR